jgi:hypothetical protein
VGTKIRRGSKGLSKANTLAYSPGVFVRKSNKIWLEVCTVVDYSTHNPKTPLTQGEKNCGLYYKPMSIVNDDSRVDSE